MYSFPALIDFFFPASISVAISAPTPTLNLMPIKKSSTPNGKTKSVPSFCAKSLHGKLRNGMPKNAKKSKRRSPYAVSGSGWLWLALARRGWPWLVGPPDSSGWYWLPLAGSCWLWMELALSKNIWMYYFSCAVNQ